MTQDTHIHKTPLIPGIIMILGMSWVTPLSAVTKLTAQQLTRDPGAQALRTFIKITNVSGIDLYIQGRRGWEYPGNYSDWGATSIVMNGTPKKPNTVYIQTDYTFPDGFVRCLRIAPADTQYNRLLGVFDNGPRTVFVMHEHGQPKYIMLKIDALFVDATEIAKPNISDPMGALSLFFGGAGLLPKVLEPQDYAQNPAEFQKLITKKMPNNPQRYAVTSGFAIYADTENDPGLKIYCSTSDINDYAVNSDNTDFVTQWEDPLIEGAVKASEAQTAPAA